MNHRLRGFTLIELLIVVAIIAILAAIAVPNFLEAQTRSKVSRAKADMRSVATAMEAYYVDNNSYVPGNSFGVAGRVPAGSAGVPSPNNLVLERLSTPVAYITTGMMSDPFKARKRSGSVIGGTPPLNATMTNTSAWTATPMEGDPQNFLYRTYLYISTAPAQGTAATNASGIMRVVGGATDPKPNGYIMKSASPMEALINAGGVIAGWKAADCSPLIYDPTNGTISFGQIWRTGGSPGSQDNLFGAVTNQR
jgi:prepilin-type N-terminal cleavage/methylation domain-containing protein